MNGERELQAKMAAFLSRYFHVEREVRSVCGTARIDLMLTHKSDPDKLFPIGIEVKLEDNKQGAQIGEWLLQVIRYKQCAFTGYKRPIPFIYPQLSGLYFEEGQRMAKHDVLGGNAHHGINGMLGAMEIGELQRFKDMRYVNHLGTHWHYRLSFLNWVFWDSRDNRFDIEKIQKFTFHKLSTPKLTA